MSNRIKFAAFGMAAFTLGTQGFAQEAPNASTVIASVNGHEITLGHMILLRDDLPDQYKQYPDDILFQALFNQAVEQTLLAETVDGEPSASVKYSIENTERDLRSGLAVERIFDEQVTDQDVQAAYQSTYLDADLGLEYNASHILVETEDAAISLLQELQAGQDFAEAAQEHSTGPSGPNGGSLGWFVRGSMVPAFDETVATMDVGELSEPVQTQFGWHLIKLNETRPVEAPAYDLVSEELIEQIGTAALTVVIDDLKAKADIVRIAPEDFDVSLLGDLSLIED